MEYRPDCRHFLGDKPCRFREDCSHCEHFSPLMDRMLIIKLGASGDVLRTTPILPALRERHPNAQISWLTDESAREVLQANPLIDRLLLYNLETVLRLQVEEFSRLICLDKEARATALAMTVRAGHKNGFGLSPQGNVIPLNPEASYAFLLGLSDELKFRLNRKSYQEMIFEALGLSYRHQEYVLALAPEHLAYGRDVMAGAGAGPDDIVVGLCVGAGTRFANKAWTEEGFSVVARALAARPNTRAVLLGGKLEESRVRSIRSRLGESVFDPGCHHSLGQFAGIVNCCDVVVSPDTVCMHLAIGLKKLVLAIFGPTCPQEVELYGRGAKVVSPLPCAPCYRENCDIEETCMRGISPEMVMKELLPLLTRARDSRQATPARSAAAPQENEQYSPQPSPPTT